MSATKVVSNEGKLYSLESVRGLAALAVAMSHFIGFFPPIAYQGSVGGLMGALFIDTPLVAFINGVFAVTVFFVLSGFVLSYGFFRREADLVSATLKRYFRLMPVAFVSVLLAFVLLKLHLFQNTFEVIPIATWRNENITLLQAIWEGIAGIFIMNTNPDRAVFTLNPVLWTIYYELLGSVLVYAILSLTGKDPRRLFVYLLAIVVFLNTYFVGFIVGIVLADVYCNRMDVVAKVTNLPVVYKIVALVAAVYFASFPAFGHAETLRTIYKPVLFLADSYDLNRSILYLIASFIVITLALTSRRLRGVLESRPLIYLGSVSYALYAVHYIALGCIAPTVFLSLAGKVSYNKSVLAAFVIYIIGSFVLAHIIYKYVDQPSLRLSKLIGRKITKK